MRMSEGEHREKTEEWLKVPFQEVVTGVVLCSILGADLGAIIGPVLGSLVSVSGALLWLWLLNIYCKMVNKR
jgi:hypothetical protein